MAQASSRGRPVSWIAVLLMLVFFLIGGVGLVLGPAWPVFVVGAVGFTAAGIFGLATGIMSDVH